MDVFIVELIKIYNQARLELESRFAGLTHTHMCLINVMISRADPITGIVEGISYRELCALLAVDHACGRKGAGIPKKETIRSYLRTIAETFPEEFKLISQGHKLRMQFLNLPAIYASFFDLKKEYTDASLSSNTAKSIENIEKDSEIELVFGLDETIESPISISAIKNINNKNINNNYNKPAQRMPIADDFVPTPATIAKAEALGLESATDFAEIQAFISHNQAIGSLWVDYNPVYLRWLVRAAEFKQQKSKSTVISRSGYHASIKGSANKLSAVERVKRAYARDFDFDEESRQFFNRERPPLENTCHLMVAAY